MTDTRITDFEAVAPMPIYTQADLDAAVQKAYKLCIHDCHEFATHLRCFKDKKGAEIVDGVAAVIAARCDKEPA
jgi:hypothetical protein